MKFYDVDSFKQRISQIACRVFQTVEKELEKTAELMARTSQGKIKNIEIGDRVYLKDMARQGKLSPFFKGPFRVVGRISPVVYKLRSIATGKEGSWHSNKIRIIPEGMIDQIQNRNVRRPFPVDMEEVDSSEVSDTDTEGEQDDTNVDLRNSVVEDRDRGTQDTDDTPGPAADLTSPPDIPVETIELQSNDTNPTYHSHALRSKGRVAPLPYIMDKPIEHLEHLPIADIPRTSANDGTSD